MLVQLQNLRVGLVWGDQMGFLSEPIFLRSPVFGLTTDVTLPLALGVGHGSGGGG